LKFFWLISILVGRCALYAQETETPKPWQNQTELSAVSTTGNAEVLTLGFGNEYTYRFEKAEFVFKANAISNETTTFTRVARQTADGIRFEEESETERSAENYNLDLKYSQEISKRVFWLGRAKWNRNVPAGIDSRSTLTLGVGNKWLDEEKVKFSSDYGLSYSREEPVADLPDFEKSYPSLDLSYKWFKQVSPSSQFQQDFSLIRNLGEAKDTRLELKNGLSVAISERLALKVTLDFQYDSQPLFELLPVPDGTGTPTGMTLPYELDDLDTNFTCSLVITF